MGVRITLPVHEPPMSPAAAIRRMRVRVHPGDRPLRDFYEYTKAWTEHEIDTSRTPMAEQVEREIAIAIGRALRQAGVTQAVVDELKKRD